MKAYPREIIHKIHHDSQVKLVKEPNRYKILFSVPLFFIHFRFFHAVSLDARCRFCIFPDGSVRQACLGQLFHSRNCDVPQPDRRNFSFLHGVGQGRLVQDEISSPTPLARYGRRNGIRPVVLFHVAIASGYVDYPELHVADMDCGDYVWNRPLAQAASV